MIVEEDVERRVFRKTAEGPGERRSLAVEAAVLAAGAHPGVVQVLNPNTVAETGVLEMRRVDGSTIGDRSPLGAFDTTWIGAALAATVADLHDIGITHGAIGPDHVLLDSHGRPVLCGFGHARQASCEAESAAARRADVAALATLLIDVCREPVGQRVSAALREAAGGRRRTAWRRRAVDARSLARILGAAARASQQLAAGKPPRRKRSIWLERPAAVIATLAVVTSAVMYATLGRARSGDRITATVGSVRNTLNPTGPCPPADGSCVALPAGQRIIGGRFRILGVAGLTLIGRWTCESVATPAVLDEASGDVWVFDSWPPPGHRVVARLAATVPRASGMKVRPAGSPGPTGPRGCDRIEVDRLGLGPVLIDPKP